MLYLRSDVDRLWSVVNRTSRSLHQKESSRRGECLCYSRRVILLHRNRRTLQRIAWFALCVVVLRSLVPPGFMLGQDSAGHNGIVFCHGIAMESEGGEHHGEHAPASGKSAHAELCTFSASGAGALLDTFAACAATQVDADDVHVIREGRLPSESRPIRAQTSRGPPSILFS